MQGILFEKYLITHTCPASTLEWQPSGKLLSVGWSDGNNSMNTILTLKWKLTKVIIILFVGMLSIWKVDIDSKPVVYFSNATEHKSTTTVLKWSPSGQRLITGDKVCIFFNFFVVYSSCSTNIIRLFA